MIYNQLSDKMTEDWIRERAQNIFWTILEDYSKDMPNFIVMKESAKARHLALVWGSVFLYADISLLRAFDQHISTKPDFYAIFSQILRIALEEYCLPKLAAERPAVKDLAAEFYGLADRQWEKRLAKTSAEILEKAYYADKQGKLGKDNIWLKALLADITRVAETAGDTAGLITGVEEIYGNYFATENWINKIAGQVEKTEAAKRKVTPYKPDETFMQVKRGVAAAEVFVEKIVDAEFNPNSYRGKAAAKYLEQEKEKAAKLAKLAAKRKQSDFDKVRIFFGDMLLPQSEIERIENKISTGIHEHKKLYVTDGDFSSLVSDYQLRFLEEQRNFNLEYLEVHDRECRRQIESLRSLLIHALLPDSKEDSRRANYGSLRSGEVWRTVILHDYKVFEHIQKNEIGNLAVEILLDGSGSQTERQAQVAMQGYIIAQALSLCNIPCRVSAYATFLDYTIFRVYRDYDSPRGQNKKIFDFFGTGMNRDGFAFRAVADFMQKRAEENKILIIFSDGKPNDVRVFKKDAEKPELKDYTGEVAVRDTAMEVRKLRLQGISVLGVFNGLDEDLPAQKKIYGHDFAYIKKMNQFSKIVGSYLKKELHKMM
ncbi:hypothetical protein EII17_00745 [Clostridiales bacterium COT073_COT-073]|nr:hypothetical protein EII17_00745 [Clostridiales bacterium COT073_COT-073]